MKVKNVDYDTWEIYVDDKVVGNIQTFHGFRGNSKTVYAGEIKDSKRIGDIKNQKEAIQKLQTFFRENKEAIKNKEEVIQQLDIGIGQVEHQVCIDALEKEKVMQIKELEELKKYDLI
ncbi:hypothetical protein [Priestia megaterium]|uniref:hypothetical protein n=1 Tax=Priestia megaterium TaxID=1404 RepID=UPI000BFE67CF|nr:hypothetical protein [Priestia megaterium]PGO60654.1 hypothetical protein CN981_08885 [Priestia megaterium]